MQSHCRYLMCFRMISSKKKSNLHSNINNQNGAEKYCFMVSKQFHFPKKQELLFDKSIIRQSVSKCLTCKNCRLITIKHADALFSHLSALLALCFSGSYCLFLPGVNNVICHRQASVQEMTFRNLTLNWTQLAKLRHLPSPSLSCSHLLSVSVLADPVLLLPFNSKFSV